MLKLQLAGPSLPPGAEWKWSRVTNICGFVLVLAGFIAKVAGHVPLAPLAYSVLAIIVFAFGAWRRSVHLAAYARGAAERIEASERLAAIGLATTAFAHEMKNGVMVAQGFAELSRRTAEGASVPPALMSQLQSLETQTGQLTADLQAFLALSQGEAVAQKQIPLRTALDRTWHLLGPLARQKNLQLDSELDGVPDREVAEPSFRQGLLNLGLNAIEHAHTLVRLGAITKEGDIVVSVEDDGPGIPPEQRKLLFTPFFTRREAGTGFGLTQSRLAVEREGGRISYEEVDGGGARFKLRLPLVRPASE